MVAVPGIPLQVDLAPGHVNGQRTENWTFDAAAPSMGLRSSARELATLLSLCLAGSGGPLHQDLMETLKPLRKTDYGFVGLGWGIAGSATNSTYLHSGGIVGYQSFLGFNAKSKRGVAVLANTAANSMS